MSSLSDVSSGMITPTPTLGWVSIIRLGLVQTALGAVIVLTTSTLNRIMVVELALPAMLPGFLVAVHHIVQLARPHIGHSSDVGGRRTPWIIGGMLVLAVSGFLAALGTLTMADSLYWGVPLAALGFLGIGLGSGATGTSLLVLLAKQVPGHRKAAAATIVWFMMILGFAVTAGVAGHFLDPFSPERLLMVTATVSVLAMSVTLIAMRGIEGHEVSPAACPVKQPLFMKALAEVWQEQEARQFTLFVAISMLAYSFQDLILEPFAGLMFGMTPGESTQLAGTQHGGVLLGMLAVAATGSLTRSRSARLLRLWTVGGCLASALALFALATGGLFPSTWNLSLNVFLLGFTNGAFAVAAIASMMMLASQGGGNREGLRMGLWGAAQAIAFAIGGFLGTVTVDIARQWLADPAHAYGATFILEGLMFLAAARLGAGIRVIDSAGSALEAPSFGQVASQEMMMEHQ